MPKRRAQTTKNKDDRIQNDTKENSDDSDGGREHKKPRVTISVGGEKLLVPLPNGQISLLVDETERRVREIPAALATLVKASGTEWKLTELRMGSADGALLEMSASCTATLRDGDNVFAKSASTRDSMIDTTSATRMSDSKDGMETDHVSVSYVTASNPIPRSLGRISRKDCHASSLARLIARLEAPSLGLSPDTPFPGEAVFDQKSNGVSAKSPASKLVAEHAQSFRGDKEAIAAGIIHRQCACAHANILAKALPDDVIYKPIVPKPSPPSNLVPDPNCPYCHSSLNRPCVTACKTSAVQMVDESAVQMVDETKKCGSEASACTVVIGHCGHDVHTHCLSEWRAKHDTCPQCLANWQFRTKSNPQGVMPSRIRIVTGPVFSSEGNVLTFDVKETKTIAGLRDLIGRKGVDIWSRALMNGGEPVRADQTPWTANSDCTLALCRGGAHAVPLVVSVRRPNGTVAQLASDELTTQSTVRDALLVRQKMEGVLPDDYEVFLEDGSGVRADCPLWRLSGPSSVVELALREVSLSSIWVDVHARACRIAPSLSPEDTIGLLQAEVPLPSSESKSQVSRANELLVFAVCRRVRADTIITNACTPKRGDAGFQTDNFVHAAAWRTSLTVPREESSKVQERAPSLVSTKAMSTFLSTLYVLASTMTDRDKRARTVGRWRTLTHDFAPGVAAFRRLVHRRSLSDADKAALAASMFALARSLVPPKVSDEEILSHSRALMGYVMTSASPMDGTADGIRHKNISLLDGVTRIVEPERAVAPSPSDTFRCGVVAREKVKAEIEAAEKIQAASAPFQAAVPPSAIADAPSLLITAQPSPPARYEWRPCSLMRAWLAATPHDEISIELPPTPPPSPLTSSSTAITASSESNKLPAWPTMVAMARREASLILVSPLALVGAPRPSLTKDEFAHVAIFTGRGKGADAATELFCPIRGGERAVDAQRVAAALAALGSDDQDESDMMVQRPPNEGILLCLDVSNSMQGRAGFKNTEGKKNGQTGKMAEDSDDEADGQDTFSVIWQSADRDESKLAVEEQEALASGLTELKIHRNLPDLQFLAGAIGIREVVIEWCRMKANKAFARAASVAREKFYALLRAQVKRALPDATDRNVPPADILCPLSRTIMTCPVMYEDGIVYDKENIARWIRVHGEWSPMTGQRMSVTPGLPMHNPTEVRIEQWKNLRAEYEKRQALAVIGNTLSASAAKSLREGSDATAPPAGQDAFWMSVQRLNEPPRRAAARPKMSLGELRRNVATLYNLSSSKRVRLMHAGKMLEQSARTLTALDLDRTALLFMAEGDLADKGGSSDAKASTIVKDEKKSELAKYKRGARVQAQWTNLRFYPATITDVIQDEHGVIAISVLYDDQYTRTLMVEQVKLEEAGLDVPVTDSGGVIVGTAGARVCIQVVNAAIKPSDNFCLAVERDEPVSSVKIRIWRAAAHQSVYSLGPRLRPTVFHMKTKGHQVGDGYISAFVVREWGTFGSYLGADAAGSDDRGLLSKGADAEKRSATAFGAGYSSRPPMYTKPVNIWLWKNQPEARRDVHLSRLEVAQQVFHAFVNRQQAYNYPKHLGLSLFGTEVKQTCTMTPLYEHFRTHVDKSVCDGDTALYNALDEGCTVLEAFALKYPKALRRILVLSDGRDTSSTKSAYVVARRLQEAGVMVDAVQIGTDRDSTLTSIVRATGGFCFAPESIAECVNICELETLLCRHERVPPETFSPISASWDLQMVPGRNTFDSCDGGAAPPRREDPNLKLPVQSLPTAIRRNAKVMDDTKGNKSTHDRNRRLMIEMKRLEQTPHPAFDVYPSESDIGFWKLVVEGASSTPYHEGGWLLSIHFPTDFPESPPEVRFETPILHMNVSRYGKICFSLLDRNWSSDTTIREVLDGIYGLLLNPDHADPLNTTLALSYHNADGTYQAKILEHVRIHASISRAKWKARIETGDNSTSASSSSGTVPHEDSADDS